MSSPLHLLHSCSPISARSDLYVSRSALCSHCGTPGQVYAKHAGSHLIQTFILFSSEQRMCCQYSAGFFSCSRAILWAMVFFLDVVHRGWLHATSDWTVTETPVSTDNSCAKSAALARRTQGCINSEFCLLLLLVVPPNHCCNYVLASVQ